MTFWARGIFCLLVVSGVHAADLPSPQYREVDVPPGAKVVLGTSGRLIVYTRRWRDYYRAQPTGRIVFEKRVWAKEHPATRPWFEFSEDGPKP